MSSCQICLVDHLGTNRAVIFLHCLFYQLSFHMDDLFDEILDIESKYVIQLTNLFNLGQRFALLTDV